MDFTAIAEGRVVAPAPTPEPVNNPLNMVAVKATAATALAAVNDMAAQAVAVVVESDADYENAVAMGAQAKKLAKTLEDLRKQSVAEPNDFVKQVNNFFRPFSDRLGDIEAVIKRKMGEFRQRKQIEAAKREKEAAEKAAALQKKLDEEAKAAGVQTITLAPPPPAPVTPKVVRTESGSASVKLVWTFELVDPALVPREYLLVDDRRIRQAVKDGIREIPGVKIYQSEQDVFRV